MLQPIFLSSLLLNDAVASTTGTSGMSGTRAGATEATSSTTGTKKSSVSAIGVSSRHLTVVLRQR